MFKTWRFPVFETLEQQMLKKLYNYSNTWNFRITVETLTLIQYMVSRFNKSYDKTGM